MQKSPESPQVYLDGTALFPIKNSLGNLSPEERAETANITLEKIAANDNIIPDLVRAYPGDQEGIPLTIISAENQAILSISEADAKALSKSRAELAAEYVEILRAAITSYRQARTAQNLIRGILLIVMATIGMIIGLLIMNNLFGSFYKRLKAWGDRLTQNLHLGGFEIIRANQVDNLLIFIIQVIQTAITIALFAIYIPFTLNQLPWTKRIATLLNSYLWETINSATESVLNYFPNLLTILLVATATFIALRFSRTVFQELHEGILRIPGFYRDWAKPTYRLVTFLVIALAAVIVFPLLPGFSSPAFGGISVFLGLLLSLGSTSAIANVVAGTILIYTRAFKVGDRIRIGTIYGQVIETTLLITRLMTATNVVVSIPNSQIITSSVENFSFSSKEFEEPLIIQSIVHLGYEVDWRDAYKALLKAAARTQGIVSFPKPFILQESLNDVYVTYQLNAYVGIEYLQTRSIQEMEVTRSRLNENIRDCCASVGIQIFAPSYEADPVRYGPSAQKHNHWRSPLSSKETSDLRPAAEGVRARTDSEPSG